MARDTTTGAVLENMVLPSLTKGGYIFNSQVNIGDRIGGGRHFADVVATKGDDTIIISLKWQQVSGTAEQKVPFEVISLIASLKDGHANKAYLVLGGAGWKLRDFYTGNGLDKYINGIEAVNIVTLEEFIAVANAGSL
ncbi:MAG TPA: PD-(D/E)XK nuclease superfamily protein [Candidatus Saccharimonadia bacterium]|nr:PD-(D/E)XK nuclease superfamily protein [Candidatus Saccharimonadia bacterium]